MAEKRQKTMAVCVKNGAIGSGTMEFFPAEAWSGATGFYRVRLGRRWVNGTRGAKCFLDAAGVAAVLAYQLFGVDVRENARNDAPPPNMVRNARCSVPNGNGPMRDVTSISTERPFRGADGRWYIGAYVIGRGVVMVPCDDVILK